MARLPPELSRPDTIQLYGTSVCPYTSELREHLLWQGLPFVEYDVATDMDARRRMFALTSGPRSVPMLVRQGQIVKVSWRGGACLIDPADST
jgi:glutaredoxin